MTGNREEQEPQFRAAALLNNQGVELTKLGRYAEAEEVFLKSINLKLGLFGEKSVTTCISVSGLADNYLFWARKQGGTAKAEKLRLARREAERMMWIAREIRSAEQERVAREILSEIAALDGLPAERVDIELNARAEGSVYSTSHRPVGGSASFTVSVEPPTRRCYNPSCPLRGAGAAAAELSHCSRCRKVMYCGKECQRAHWSEHKRYCVPQAS
jgi:hypothetical protein